MNKLIATHINKSPREAISAAFQDGQQSYFLPPDFVPGPNHVICARGKAFWEHSGNKRYRVIIAAATEKYAKATNKLDKSLIVSEIVEKINEEDSNNNTDTKNSRGGFIKRHISKNGKRSWVQVDDNFVRDKIGQSLRDSLHDRYRSSTKSKQSRRSKVTEKVDMDVHQVIHSNLGVSRRIEQLCLDMKQQQEQETANEKSISSILFRANLDILERIKKDGSLLAKFQDATVSALETTD